MNTKFKLTSLLNIAFYSLLFLLVAVAGIALLGLQQGQSNFVEYRALARDTNLAGRLQANMLMTRLNVLKYIKDDSPEILQSYRDRLTKMEEFLEQAKMEIQSPKRAPKITEATRLITEYKQTFQRVVALIDKRHDTVEQDLDPTGLRMRQKMSEIMEHTRTTNNIESLYRSAKAQEALLLGRLYVVKFLVSNADTDYQRAKSELGNNIQDELKALRNVMTTEKSSKLMNEFTVYYEKYTVALDEVYAIIKERNNLIENTLNRNGPVIADHIEQVKLSVKSEQDELGPRAQQNVETSAMTMKIIALISIIGGIVATYFLKKAIHAPIGGEPSYIASLTSRIAKGDLSHQFSQPSQATGIYSSIINMTGSLRTLIKQVVTTGKSIAENAKKSAEIAKTTNASVLEQKERASHVATAVNEMAYSIQEMVNISSQSAETAREGQVQAEKGKSIVDGTVASINSLANTVRESVLTMKTLEQNSQEIGSIVEVIKNISDQTNLLALNAAIEAARAGEQGRGFAVVADEVRTLAQRTKESTDEIQATINTLQEGTQNAVRSMEESGREANETVTQSSATGEALDKVLETINKITDMNYQVAMSVEEQSTVMEDISANITSISESLDNTTSTTAEAADSAAGLSKLASNLQNSVQDFKLT